MDQSAPLCTCCTRRQRRSRRRHLVNSAWCKDRCCRLERIGQVDAAAGDGGTRAAVEWRRAPAPGISVRLLAQEPVLDKSKAVLGNVRDGVAEILALRARYESIVTRLAKDYSEQLITEMGSLQEQLDINDAWDIDARLKQAMEALCCPPPDAEVRDLSWGERRSVEVPSRAHLAAFGFKGADQQKPARLFSRGERNRLNLALTLKRGGNVLLLDEPTNDLDTETLASLENAIGEFPGCVVVTAHDRWFLDRLATHILACGDTETTPAQWYWFEGNFGSYEHNKISRLGAEAARPHRTTNRRLIRG
jgi:ATPase subunit of ABC transporter with duplicated ATPase domains